MVGALRSSGRIDVWSTLVAYNTCAYRWEADILICRRSGYLEEIEVKVSVADFKHDTAKVEKHLVLTHGEPTVKHAYRSDPRTWDWSACAPIPIRRFWYAVPGEIAEKCEALLPAHAGLIRVDTVRRNGAVFYTSRDVVRAPDIKRARRCTDAEREAIYRTMYYKCWKTHRIAFNRRRDRYVQLQLPGMD
jgi:hypothetical protein